MPFLIAALLGFIVLVACVLANVVTIMGAVFAVAFIVIALAIGIVDAVIRAVRSCLP